MSLRVSQCLIQVGWSNSRPRHERLQIVQALEHDRPIPTRSPWSETVHSWLWHLTRSCHSLSVVPTRFSVSPLAVIASAIEVPHWREHDWLFSGNRLSLSRQLAYLKNGSYRSQQHHYFSTLESPSSCLDRENFCAV